MRIDKFSFGTITIDGVAYNTDVVIDAGTVRKRKKRPSKQYRDRFGHTPLSVNEEIPWEARRLVVGTGAYGSLPVMEEVVREAKKRGVKLVTLRTAEAIKVLTAQSQGTNAVLHVTC